MRDKAVIESSMHLPDPAELEALLDEVLHDTSYAFLTPWGIEEVIQGDGHWDNEWHVRAEGGEGMHLATFEFHHHAEAFALLPQIARLIAERAVKP